MPGDHINELQQGLDPQSRLYQIVEHGMCIGCGICQSVAGPDVVSMEIVDNGCLRPLVVGELSHGTMDKIIDICPGTRVDGLPRQEINDESLRDPVWGVWRQIVYAWSAEPEIRHIAATGGVLTALALYLVESGEVDFIVHACEPSNLPTFGARLISRSRDDVLKGSGSRYGPTATLIDIVEILDSTERNGERFAFIGTPCDVSALRNYARHDSRVGDHCDYMLAMVCGGFMEPASTTVVLKQWGVEFDEVASLRYRGFGCPGPTTVTTTDGRVVEMNYLDFWGEDQSAWQLPSRCKICPDGIGDAADIAAADTWDGGAPGREGQDDDPGFNAAIVRTERGVGLMERAVAAGYLAKGDQLGPEDMNRFQPHQETKKRTVWARYLGIKSAGNIVPDTSGLRLQQLYRENDEGINLEQLLGAQKRVQQGKFSETKPCKTVKS